MNTKEQGAIGVAKAIAYYVERGGKVFVPVSDTARYDLVVDIDNQLLRVEVKSTVNPKGQFMIRTCGGNQSWNGEVKRLSHNDCDKVVLVNLITGNLKEVGIAELDGRASVTFR